MEIDIKCSAKSTNNKQDKIHILILRLFVGFNQDVLYQAKNIKYPKHKELTALNTMGDK